MIVQNPAAGTGLTSQALQAATPRILGEEEIARQAGALGYRLARIAPVAETDVPVLAALTRAWERIRREDDHIPPVVIDLTPGRGSSCSSIGWADDVRIMEINLRDGDQNLTGRRVLELLLHHAAHAVAGPVSSAEGRYHNQHYRSAATSLGLEAALPGTASTGSGWSNTSLARGAVTRYQPEIAALDRALQRWEPTEQAKTRRDSRNPALAMCSCVPPRKLRVRQKTLALGAITCEICQNPFSLAEASPPQPDSTSRSAQAT